MREDKGAHAASELSEEEGEITPGEGGGGLGGDAGEEVGHVATSLGFT